MAQKEVTIYKSRWLSRRGDVFTAIDTVLSCGDKRCALGFVCEQAFGVDPQAMEGKSFPSEVGVGIFRKKNPLGTSLEDEISQINDKVEDYAFISDEQQEQKLKDKFKKAGFRLSFQD